MPPPARFELHLVIEAKQALIERFRHRLRGACRWRHAGSSVVEVGADGNHHVFGSERGAAAGPAVTPRLTTIYALQM